MAQATAALGGAAQAGAASPPPLLRALQLFGPEQGLDRAAALAQDLQRIAARSLQQVQRQAQEPAAVAADSREDYALPQPTQHAAALAAHFAGLARLCRVADGPAEEEQVGVFPTTGTLLHNFPTP